MRAHDVRLRRYQFGWFFFRVDVLRCPDDRLTNRHVQKILPAKLFFFLRIEHVLRMHVDRAFARLDLFDHRMIAQARRHRLYIDVVANALLDLGVAVLLIELTRRIRRVRFEQQKPCANRTVTVFEARENGAARRAL